MTSDALIGGRYRLVRELGSGGMSVVWEARDELLDRDVAVKQLRIQSGLSEQEAQVVGQRAMREARINARLHHPHVVTVFDVVEYEGQPSLVMELVSSETLAEALRERGRLEPSEAAQIGSQVASALAAAHGLGIVHRDVKPSNILLGEDGRARISDFGISRAFDDTTLTMTGMINGTPAYLAPEVARGREASPAADVFSLGSTLYAALEGSPPFGTDGSSIALLYKVAEGDIPTPRRAGNLAPLLGRMLARDPETRPPMDEVATTLLDLSGEVSPLTEDDTGTATVAISPPTGAQPAVGAMGAGAAAAVAGAAEAETVSAARPDPPTAVLVAVEPETATTPEPPSATAVPPAPVSPSPAPPVPDDKPGRRRRSWIAAAAVVTVLLAAVAVAGLLWPRAIPSTPDPNATAVPSESGRSEQQTEDSAGNETDARETERTNTNETTDEPTDEPSEEPTASNEQTETSESDETTSEPTETQSSEADGDNSGEGDGDSNGEGEGDNSGQGRDG